MKLLDNSIIKILFIIFLLFSVIMNVILTLKIIKYENTDNIQKVIQDEEEIIDNIISEDNDEKLTEEDNVNTDNEVNENKQQTNSNTENKTNENKQQVNENNHQSNNNQETEKEKVDVKTETWLKLKGGWKSVIKDKPGLTYATREEMELYQDEYASVYYYLYFTDDYKMFYSYCAINYLQNHDNYTNVKIIDSTHIDVKGYEHYISILDDNVLVIDGKKFVRSSDFEVDDFYNINNNYCVTDYHCPIYSK